MVAAPTIITAEALLGLVRQSGPQIGRLRRLYAKLPATRCQRRAMCCALLAEISLIEAVAVVDRLVRMPPHQRAGVVRRLVCYFLINPVEIVGCPFLTGNECLIYADRFFGCRAYGLWTPEHYARIAASERDAKRRLQGQWHKLGIDLPRHVVDLRVPYCDRVRCRETATVDDAALQTLTREIEFLSQSLGPLSDAFIRFYFADLSFLTASLALGMPAAVQAKLAVVRAITARGDRGELRRHLVDLTDPFEAPSRRA
jgi:hypothetical protein